MNYYGQTVTSLVENPEMRKFLTEMINRDTAADGDNNDPEYAEIVEDAEEATENIDIDGVTAAVTDEHENNTVTPTDVFECFVCSEVVPLVTFLPCFHKV